MQIRRVTQQAVGAVMAGTALLQVPQVADAMKSLVLHHPHLSSVLGAALVIASLLHNPQVIEILGLKTEEVIKTQTVVPIATPSRTPEGKQS